VVLKFIYNFRCWFRFAMLKWMNELEWENFAGNDFFLNLFIFMHRWCVVRYTLCNSQAIEVSLIYVTVKIFTAHEAIIGSFSSVEWYWLRSLTGIQWCEWIFHSLIDHTNSFILIWLADVSVKICILQIWSRRLDRCLYVRMCSFRIVHTEMICVYWRKLWRLDAFNSYYSSVHFRWFQIL